jgi:hypothetical protein
MPEPTLDDEKDGYSDLDSKDPANPKIGVHLVQLAPNGSR